jgi:hypothetical protein
MRKFSSFVIAGALLAVPVVGVASPADAVVHRWKNCTIVNQRLPHGVGLNRAHDKTSGVPVTNFRHDSTMYRKAMNANRGLDRDKDGIACEKR